jgi:hypothetical protein
MEDLQSFIKKYGIRMVNGVPSLSIFDNIQIWFSNDKKAMDIKMRQLWKMQGIDPDKVMMGNVDKNFYHITRLLAGKNDKARQMLEKTGIEQVMVDENGTIGYETLKSEEGEAMTIGWLLQPLSLAPNFSKLSAKKAMKQLNDDKKLAVKFMTMQRTKELMQRDEFAEKQKQGKGITGVTIDQWSMPDSEAAKQWLDDFELNYDDATKARIKEFAKRYRGMADATLKYAAKKGLMSEETYNEIKEKNMHYVSLSRIYENEIGDVTNPNGYGFGQKPTKVVKKIEGSERDRLDAVENLIANFYATINRADENYRNKAVVDLLKGEGSPGTPMPLSHFGEQITVRPGADIPPNTLVYYNDGKPEYWQLDPEFAPAFEGIKDLASRDKKTEGVANVALKLFGLRTKTLQFGITTWATFAKIINPIRDLSGRKIQSRSSGMPLSSLPTTAKRAGMVAKQKANKWAKKLGLSEELFSDLNFDPDEFEMPYEEARKKFFLYGGGQSGHDLYLKSEKHYHTALYHSMQELSAQGKFTLLGPKALWRKYEDWLTEGELKNRIIEFRNAYKKFRKDGMSEYAAYKRAAFEARDLCDFACRGTMMQYLKHATPFINASIQGTKRSVKFVSDMYKGLRNGDPTLAVRFSTYSALPSVLCLLAAAAAGDEELEEYRESADYERDMYYKFRIPGIEDWFGNGWVSVPKPFEVGIMGSFFERMVDRVAFGNEKALSGWAGTFSRGMIPINPADPMSMITLTGSFQPIFEVAYNRDSFRDTPIVSKFDEGRIVKGREGRKYSSNMALFVSEMLGEKVDPRNVDYMVKSWFGYWGEFARKTTNMIPVEREKPLRKSDIYSMEPESVFHTLRLYRHASPRSLKVVKNVMENAVYYSVEKMPDATQLESYIQGYNSAETPKEKKGAMSIVIKWARELDEKYKEKGAIYEKYLDGELDEYEGYDLKGWDKKDVRRLIFQ